MYIFLQILKHKENIYQTVMCSDTEVKVDIYPSVFL